MLAQLHNANTIVFEESTTLPIICAPYYIYQGPSQNVLQV